MSYHRDDVDDVELALVGVAVIYNYLHAISQNVDELLLAVPLCNYLLVVSQIDVNDVELTLIGATVMYLFACRITD